MTDKPEGTEGVGSQSMKKKTLASILFAIISVIFLIVGLEERVIDGGPIHYAQIGLAVTFFAIAIGVRRNSGD